nr:hepatic lectin-like [Misgurnus anguillicaudatus]
MDTIYENADFIDLSINKASYCEGVHQNRDLTQSKCTKVLLLVLCISVVLAVGGLCVLGVLYNNQLGDFESLRVQHQKALMQLSTQEINATSMERNLKALTANLTTVRHQLSFYKEFNASSCKLCEEGWTSYGGKCYFFSSEKMTWFEARDLCAGSKAHLVTINSKAEQDLLVSKINETHWIGLNDQETEGRWVWVNNQTLEEAGVKFWLIKAVNSEPNNWTGDNPSGEDCACLGFERAHLNSWFDASCEYKKKFICEKEFIAL